MTFAKLLPLAFVMIAGPQLITAIFLATTKKWARTRAFVVGAAISITATVTIAFLLGDGASNQGASNNTIDVVILVLLVGAAVHTFVTRKQSKPPKWVGKLEEAQPKDSFKLGFLLLGLFPGDILTSVSVGAYAAAHHDSWWQVVPFVLLTLLLLALPSLLVAILGERARSFLPKVRDWMNSHSWIISEIVLGLFIIIVAAGMS